MGIRKYFQSRTAKITTIVVGALLIASASFAAGAMFGFHKARFSYAWGENYERNFTGDRGMRPGMRDGFPRPPMPMMGVDGGGMRNGHGVLGEVISVSENSLVIKDRSGQENIVSVSDKTAINKYRDALKLGDIQAGDMVAVIGKPGDNGSVNADFIRVFDKGSDVRQNR